MANLRDKAMLLTMILEGKKSSFLRRLFTILILCVLVMSNSTAQQVITLSDLSTVKVDNLSDEQISKFSEKLKQSGVGLNDLEAEAKKKGMPEKEWLKIKRRLISVGYGKSESNQESGPEGSENSLNENNQKVGASEKNVLPENRVFGMDLFTNKDLTFEPNLKIATPQNYQLGSGDELLIDLYGFSEENFVVKVSADGKIKLPNIGIIQVGGLSIEQASAKIKRNLSSYYEGIGSGQTKVSIALGNIRSIKVILVGEISKPGSYTLPSVATVFNALYAAGGPNENGSFRNITVIRNNRVLAKLDVYDFLKTGIIKDNIRLQDQDVIKVFAYENRIQIKGQIKREGYFEVKPSETLMDIINTSGGFKGNAFQELIKVSRNTPSQKSVADIPNSLFGIFNPKNGDVFLVDSVLDRFENRVQIKGSVFRPGDYAIENGLTVSKLISKANGLKEDAFTSRAIIYRLKEDNSLELISFNVAEVLKGNGDIILKREDLVQIASKLELKEGFQVSINGDVINPGIFNYADNMRIEDLIIVAGGFKETASIKRIEVARRKFDIDRRSAGSEIAIVKQFSVEKDLRDNPESKFLLEPFDVITVFRESGFSEQKLVKIEGEVLFPGVYAISKNDEHITDILIRSGGININGFSEGAVLMRQKPKNASKDLVNYNKLRALKRQSRDTSNYRNLEKEEEEFTYDIVGIDLTKILKKPDSRENILMKDGDVLVIPDKRQTIFVTGEVLYPVKLIYKKGQSFRKYVNQAGGFSSRALKKRSYVVYANGTADATESFLGIKSYPKIKPGCEIVIPQKEVKRQMSTIEYVTVITSLTSLLLLTYSLIK